MNLVSHLQRLFAYDEWANREALRSLRSASPPPSRSLGLLAHIFSAERLWLERLQGQKQSLPVWPELTVEQCEAQAMELPALWRKYLGAATQDTLSGLVHYQNSKGETWDSRREDVLLHVVMHSMYHRGQIAMDLRAAGSTPAYTDFIHAVRQGLVE
ncbi:MAG: DinB family protein [Acidobacteriia bacterium]|nr:DinB family protein [Terriglobia bacterium]